MSISSSKSLHKHIFVGDFNLSNTSWPSGTSTSNIEKGFLDLFDDLGFSQLINEPTHIHGKTLDLLLCNNNQLITDFDVLPKDIICSSDHFCIKFKLKFHQISWINCIFNAIIAFLLGKTALKAKWHKKCKIK